MPEIETPCITCNGHRVHEPENVCWCERGFDEVHCLLCAKHRARHNDFVRPGTICNFHQDSPYALPGIARKRSVRVRHYFAWYDLWIGVYIKLTQFGFTLYICPLPCCVIQIDVDTLRH